MKHTMTIAMKRAFKANASGRAEAARQAREFIRDSSGNFAKDIYADYLSRLGLLTDCGCCGCEHPTWFSGDCRDDANRF